MDLSQQMYQISDFQEVDASGTQFENALRAWMASYSGPITPISLP
jgi:hypothetical protein